MRELCPCQRLNGFTKEKKQSFFINLFIWLSSTSARGDASHFPIVYIYLNFHIQRQFDRQPKYEEIVILIPIFSSDDEDFSSVIFNSIQCVFLEMLFNFHILFNNIKLRIVLYLP